MKNNSLVIYFVFRSNAGAKSTRFGGFVTRLKRLADMPKANYKLVALEDLTFCIDHKGDGYVYDQNSNIVFSDASFVYFKSWEGMPEPASMLTSYLISIGVPFEDSVLEKVGIHKPSQTWKLWSGGVTVIPTISSNKIPSEILINKTLGSGPYIVKPAKGEKGRGVQKLDSYEAIKTVIKEKPNDYLIQTYIPNEGDYRLMVYGYQTRGALFRKGQEGSVVNNTSQGGNSIFIEAKDLDLKISSLAMKSAMILNHAVAGVDVVMDENGLARVLEVNQGSQIVTGHFIERKAQSFAEFLNERVVDRYVRSKPNNRLEVIGRYTYVNLPELGAKKIFAKIDTGAYQSAIHATNIHEVETESGKMILKFTILDGHHKVNKSLSPSIAHEYEKTSIKNSYGIKQVRYLIKTRISINGRMMKTGITLTDRKGMVAPILLGRRFLRGRYLVNVEINGRGIV